MPLPFILGALAVGAAVTGAAKGLDAMDKNDKAKRWNANANKMITDIKKKAEAAEVACKKSLDDLGQERLTAMQYLGRFVKIYEKIHNIEECSSNIMEIKNVKISKEELNAYKKFGDISKGICSGAVQGGVAGGLTALGAYGGAMTFASASTGTAIASLSGAAATNATFAFFGGGSIASGGLGMAAGGAILGGLIAGPAIAILGFTMNSKAEKNLENAKARYKKVETACEQVKIGINECYNIVNVADGFVNQTRKLNNIFSNLLNFVGYIVNYSGTDYSQYSLKEKKALLLAVSVAKALKTNIEISLISKVGEINKLNYQAQNKLIDYKNSVIRTETKMKAIGL